MKSHGVMKGLLLVLGAFGIGTLWYLKHSQDMVSSQVARLQARYKEQHDILTKNQHTKAASSPETVDSPLHTQAWVGVQKSLKDVVVQVFSQVAKFNWLEPYKTPEQGMGTGSGFFISENGHFITNYHVIDEASSIHVQIPTLGKQQFEAEVVGVSPDRDIALLKLKEAELYKVQQKIGAIPFITFGDSDDIVRGNEVLVLGFPLGGQTLKSTQGIVSGRERMPDLPFAFMVTTAAINPGNSGGPAVNLNGEVVGINAARHGWSGAENVGYIIPINEVKTALNDLYKVNGVLRKPMLGGIFTAANDDLIKMLSCPSAHGWYVARVFKGSLLEKIGVCEGDILAEMNGHDLDNYGDIAVSWAEDKVSALELLNRMQVGDDIHLVLYRDGTRKDIDFKLELTSIPAVRRVYPEFESVDYEVFAGMVVMELTLNHISIMLPHAPHLMKFAEHEKQFEPSLVITHVLPNSQAQKSRTVTPGALLREVNGQKVTTLAQYRQALLKSKDSGYLQLKMVDRMVDRMVAVLPLNQILAQEPILAMRYFYRTSPLLAHFDTPSSVFMAEKESPLHG